MCKLNLAAMSYDKEAVLNALQRTGATEIKLHYEAENTVALSGECESLKEYLSNVEAALERLTAVTDGYNKGNKIKSDVLQNGFEVSYTRFMSAKDMKEDIDALVEKINSLYDEEKELNAGLSKLRRTILSARIYSDVKRPLAVENTAHTKSRFGTVALSLKQSFIDAMKDVPLSTYSFAGSDAENFLVYVCSHNASAESADAVLQSVNFSGCPFCGDETGEQLFNSLKAKEEELLAKIKSNFEETYSLNGRIHDLKIYCDYIGFELEKLSLSDKMRATRTTFLLEAYVPKEAAATVGEALTSAVSTVYYEFSEPSADDEPPVLLKNNKVVKNFEAVTNMYSPVNYREFDPNTIMAFFYSVFLGFIMADIGYGLLMVLGGSFIYMKSRRDTMIKRLGGIFAVGGIFTIIWGVLFNSFFGFDVLLPFKVMPDLQGAEMSWSLAGINVPALLIISMLIGVVQLGAGYVCYAVQCWRRGKIADGIFDGLVWAVFSVGVELAIAGFVSEFNLPVLKLVGGITAGASLLVAVVTAGRKEKLLGKFTKGFGSAYGVINYASDILSYARLYGLMLAGAVIADIISSNSVSLISSGNIAFIILGVMIMLIGHIFNLAIGLLGAYIHDARLQYVEFYGRFFEGEGELFTPLGSTHKYIYLND